MLNEKMRQFFNQLPKAAGQGFLLSTVLSLRLFTPHIIWAKTYTKQKIQFEINSPYSSWGTKGTVVSSQNKILAANQSQLGKDPSVVLAPALEIFELRKAVTVAVVDTGIDPKHPYLKNNLYFKSRKATTQAYGMDFSGNKMTTTPMDEHGHGTHVAGIIRSVFPDVRILAIKYFSPTATGPQNLSATIKALKYAVDAGVDIINYSGGGPEASPEEKAILERAKSKGILVIAAAGNDSENIDENKKGYYPASYRLSNIITVGSYDPQLRILSSSNWGVKTVDLAAPGSRISSAFITPKNLGKKIGRSKAAATSTEAIDIMTGTSQATAFVTGAAALIKAMYPHLSPQQIKSLILATTDTEPKFKNKVATSGKLNIHRALARAQELYEPAKNKTPQLVHRDEVSQQKSGKSNTMDKKVFLHQHKLSQ